MVIEDCECSIDVILKSSLRRAAQKLASARVTRPGQIPVPIELDQHPEVKSSYIDDRMEMRIARRNHSGWPNKSGFRISMTKGK